MYDGNHRRIIKIYGNMSDLKLQDAGAKTGYYMSLNI